MRWLLIVLALVVLCFALGWQRGKEFPSAPGKEVSRDELIWMNDR